MSQSGPAMFLLSLATLALTLSGALAKPDWCKAYDCPDYTTSAIADSTSARRYPDTTWVATSMVRQGAYEGTGWGDASVMFRRLFKYISGNNTEDQKIAMTVPVVTRYQAMPGGQLNVTMMFYLPRPAPPTPRDPQVYITHLVTAHMLVRTFDTYMWTSNAEYNDNLDTLRSTLTSVNLDFRPDVWYHVGYDSPWTFYRHNEVWLESQHEL